MNFLRNVKLVIKIKEISFLAISVDKTEILIGINKGGVKIIDAQNLELFKDFIMEKDLQHKLVKII